jgi:hypothetical protein
VSLTVWRCLDGLAAVQVAGLHEGAAGGVDLDLERNAEFLTVAQHGGVNRGQAGGTDVLVVAVLKCAGLGEAIGELDLGASADGPVTAANAGFACLEQGTSVAELAELIGGDQAGDASPEDQDGGSVAGDLPDRFNVVGNPHGREQSEGLHESERRAVAANLADAG